MTRHHDATFNTIAIHGRGPASSEQPSWGLAPARRGAQAVPDVPRASQSTVQIVRRGPVGGATLCIYQNRVAHGKVDVACGLKEELRLAIADGPLSSTCNTQSS